MALPFAPAFPLPLPPSHLAPSLGNAPKDWAKGRKRLEKVKDTFKIWEVYVCASVYDVRGPPSIFRGGFSFFKEGGEEGVRNKGVDD